MLRGNFGPTLLPLVVDVTIVNRPKTIYLYVETDAQIKNLNASLYAEIDQANINAGGTYYSLIQMEAISKVGGFAFVGIAQNIKEFPVINDSAF